MVARGKISESWGSEEMASFVDASADSMFDARGT
jgi:hypothetical protein